MSHSLGARGVSFTVYVTAWWSPEPSVVWLLTVTKDAPEVPPGTFPPALLAIRPRTLLRTGVEHYALWPAGGRPERLLMTMFDLDAKAMARFRALIPQGVLEVEHKNVKEALALLSRADLVLAGNTDYFHFAVGMRRPTIGFFTRFDAPNWFPKSTPWVQIIQGVKGQQVSVEEVCSKVDTLLHFANR